MISTLRQSDLTDYNNTNEVKTLFYFICIVINLMLIIYLLKSLIYPRNFPELSLYNISAFSESYLVT